MELFQAHGGKVEHSENELCPNTIVIASMDDTYNHEKLNHLKQPIFYPQALIAMWCKLESGSSYQLNVAHFSEFMLLPMSAEKSENNLLHAAAPTTHKPPSEGTGTQNPSAFDIPSLDMSNGQDAECRQKNSVADSELNNVQNKDITISKNIVHLPPISGGREKANEKTAACAADKPTRNINKARDRAVLAFQLAQLNRDCNQSEFAHILVS